jgi:acetyl/propionyl-CoA carboxylase alpha subunit
MNTRLQVEHPVTEMITGLDLVEWQLRVAAGEALPLTQEQLQLTGHAIEARIYAENTEKGFLPSIGRLTHVEWPKHVDFTHGEVRLDAGVREGDEISTYYDPMIAKLIVWGATREQARLRMQQALSQTQIVGVHTNVDFLSRVMGDEAFVSADLDTGFIERRRSSLLPERKLASDFELACAIVAVVSEEYAERESNISQAGHANDPWGMLDGWRLNGDYCRPFIWLDAETKRKIVKSSQVEKLNSSCRKVSTERHPLAKYPLIKGGSPDADWCDKHALNTAVIQAIKMMSKHYKDAMKIIRLIRNPYIWKRLLSRARGILQGTKDSRKPDEIDLAVIYALGKDRIDRLTAINIRGLKTPVEACETRWGLLFGGIAQVILNLLLYSAIMPLQDCQHLLPTSNGQA